jgi:hypothetical protein
MRLLQNFLEHFGFYDLRRLHLGKFKSLMKKIMDKKNYLEEMDSEDEGDVDDASNFEQELFLISFT